MRSPQQSGTPRPESDASSPGERALRDAIAEGEQSGPPEPFDFDAFLAAKIAAGEASYAEHGGRPATEVFQRLIARYGK